MLFNQIGFLVLVSAAATVLAADPAGSPADKGVTGSPSDPKASPAGSPPSLDATKPDAKPDAKADAKPDGKTDDKAAGPPGGDATKGTDSKGAACTCPSPSTPPEEAVKSPEEQPAKPPADDSESAAGSTFGLLSQQTHLGYLGTSLLALFAAIYV